MQHIKLFESFKKIFYSEEEQLKDSDYILLYTTTDRSVEKYELAVTYTNNLLKIEAFKIKELPRNYKGEYVLGRNTKEVHVLKQDIYAKLLGLSSNDLSHKTLYDNIYKSISKYYNHWLVLKPYYDKVLELERKGIVINLTEPFIIDDDLKGFTFNGKLIGDDHPYHPGEVSSWELLVDEESHTVYIIFANNGYSVELKSPDHLEKELIVT
jgi:hypothetical protein